MHQQTLPFTGRAYHAGREQKKFPQLKGVNRSFLSYHSTRKRNNMQQLISNYRTMFLFRGIAAVLFGIIALVWPNMTLSILVFVFGVFAVISGITAVVAALRNTEFPGWGWLLAEGILGVLVGVVALVWPGITALAFLYLLAAWAILTGV